MADISKVLGLFGVRGRFRDLEPLSSLSDEKEFALYTSSAPVTPLGHTRQEIGTSVETIDNLPSGAKRMHVYNLSPDFTVYFTDIAAQEPSASLGFPIPPEGWLLYDSEVTSDFKLIAVGGVASLAFAFYA